METKRTAHQTIWVTRVGAHSADPLSAKTHWQQATHGSCPAQRPLGYLGPSSHWAGSTPPIAGWAQAGALLRTQSHGRMLDMWPLVSQGRFAGHCPHMLLEDSPPWTSGLLLGLLVTGASDSLLTGQGRVCTSTCAVTDTSGQVTGTAAWHGKWTPAGCTFSSWFCLSVVGWPCPWNTLGSEWGEPPTPDESGWRMGGCVSERLRPARGQDLDQHLHRELTVGVSPMSISGL